MDEFVNFSVEVCLDKYKLIVDTTRTLQNTK